MALTARQKEEAEDPGKPRLTKPQRRFRNFAAAAGIYVLLVIVLKCDAFSFDWLAIGTLCVTIIGVAFEMGLRFSTRLDTIDSRQSEMAMSIANIESYLRYGKKGKFETR